MKKYTTKKQSLKFITPAEIAKQSSLELVEDENITDGKLYFINKTLLEKIKNEKFSV